MTTDAAGPRDDLTPYYEQDGIVIYHGDCLRILESAAPFAEVCCTDPPYNVGKDYGAGHDDQMDPLDYKQWCGEWFHLVRHLCKRIVVFPGHGNLGAWYDIARPSAVGCWHKPGNGASSIIGWEEWEPWLYWTGDKGMLGGSSVITAPIGKQPDTGDHPCPKPVLLMSKMLRKTRAASVLDPFMGVGTTLIAAKRMGIPAVGIERNERWCEIAAERLSQEMLPFGEATA
jgi:DNA modification methylase